MSQWCMHPHLPTSSLSTHLEISRIIFEFWATLDYLEVAEWDELAQDIKNAHFSLISLFGNGLEFDGSLWEQQRYYYLRSIYLKWSGAHFLYARPG
jgi:hypothetical protein